MIPKCIALKIGYDSKYKKDKSCLIVVQEDNNKHFEIHNVFYGAEADMLINKLINGGSNGGIHENKFA